MPFEKIDEWAVRSGRDLALCLLTLRVNMRRKYHGLGPEPTLLPSAENGGNEPTLLDFCIAANACYEARGQKRTLSKGD